mgnify:FL=1
MKNRVLFMIALIMTIVGFIGVSSILVSEALSENTSNLIYFKELILDGKDIYNGNYLLASNIVSIKSNEIGENTRLDFKIKNNSKNNSNITIECLSDKGIIGVMTKNTSYYIEGNSIIEGNLILNFDSDEQDTLECKISLLD